MRKWTDRQWGGFAAIFTIIALAGLWLWALTPKAHGYGIVKNGSGTGADSMIAAPLYVLDTLGNRVPIDTTTDWGFCFVRKPNGDSCAIDTFRVLAANTNKIKRMVPNFGAEYAWTYRRDVATLDGDGTAKGVYPYEVWVRDSSLKLWTLCKTDAFQLIDSALNNVIARVTIELPNSGGLKEAFDNDDTYTTGGFEAQIDRWADSLGDALNRTMTALPNAAAGDAAGLVIGGSGGSITYNGVGVPVVDVVQLDGDGGSLDSLRALLDSLTRIANSGWEHRVALASDSGNASGTTSDVNVVQISGDAAAADNLEANFDGTGYDDITAGEIDSTDYATDVKEMLRLLIRLGVAQLINDSNLARQVMAANYKATGFSTHDAAAVKALFGDTLTQIIADGDSVVGAIADANKANFKATGFSTHSAADVKATFGDTLTQIHADADSALKPTTHGRKIDVSAGGEAGIDWANVGSPTTAVDLSSTTIRSADSALIANIKDNDTVAVATKLAEFDEDNTTIDLNGTAVGSVVGAVGSVTGAVGSVTGNVGGNVTGSVGSVAGNVSGTFLKSPPDSVVFRIMREVWRNQDTTNVDTSALGAWLANNLAGGAGSSNWTDAQRDSVLRALEWTTNNSLARVNDLSSIGCGGDGDKTVLLTAIDTSGTDTPIPGQKMTVTTLAGSLIGGPQITNASGVTSWALSASTSYIVRTSGSGYVWKTPDTVTTSAGIGDFADSIKGYNYDPGTPAPGQNLCRVSGTIIGDNGDPLEGAVVYMNLIIRGSGTVVTDSSTGETIYRRLATDTTDANGNWSLDRKYSAYLIPTDSRKYQYVVYDSTGKAIAGHTASAIVPSTATARIEDILE